MFEAFPQSVPLVSWCGELSCVPTDKIAWCQSRALIGEELESIIKLCSSSSLTSSPLLLLLLLLYPVAARAANLHSGTPAPSIDPHSAAHPPHHGPCVQKVKFLPPPPEPHGPVPARARGDGEAGLRAEARQLRKHEQR